jgi:hypothetical protein
MKLSVTTSMFMSYFSTLIPAQEQASRCPPLRGGAAKSNYLGYFLQTATNPIDMVANLVLIPFFTPLAFQELLFHRNR